MITIIVPFPDSALLPNRRNGAAWQVTQSAKVEAKEAGRIAAIQASFGMAELPPRNVDVTIVFTPPDRRKRDVDGMLSALKPTLDGIALALLVGVRSCLTSNHTSISRLQSAAFIRGT